MAGQDIAGRFNPKGIFLLAGALTVVFIPSACSEPAAEERGYEVPNSLCGDRVPPEVLDPLLPPGTSLSFDSTGEDSPLGYCRLKVDGEQVLSVGIEWHGEGTELREAANIVVGLRGRDRVGLGGEGEKVIEESPYMYSRTGAIAEVRCKDPRMPGMKLFVSARIDTERTPKASEMKHLIASYSRAVGNSNECV
ncbi:hypothetical protein GCM10010420_07010 [Streptomyces glaucosporus]|uniref:DUF3558 domain-containing protein n=1 Tax=Streptomyces glaucosporus TaxID=284044 RepID=A0ABP5US85_9ACTN